MSQTDSYRARTHAAGAISQCSSKTELEKSARKRVRKENTIVDRTR